MKKFREKAGYTQQQVSDSLNIDRSTYAYYESGKTIPDLNTLVKLAEIFKIPLGMLLEKEQKNLVFSDVGSNYWNSDKKMLCNLRIETENNNNKSNNLIKGNSSEQQNSNFVKYPSFISDLSEKEKKMVLCFRLLSSESQDKINEIISEKFKNIEILKN